MECCKTCFYWRANRRQKTVRERWEEDTRPDPKGFFGFLKFLYDPSKYRDLEPDEFDEVTDKFIRRANESGSCTRFPRIEQTHKNYKCGEYTPIEISKGMTK